MTTATRNTASGAKKRDPSKNEKFVSQKNYASRMKAQGFERFCVWLPPSAKKELTDKAAELRIKHLATPLRSSVKRRTIAKAKSKV